MIQLYAMQESERLFKWKLMGELVTKKDYCRAEIYFQVWMVWIKWQSWILFLFHKTGTPGHPLKLIGRILWTETWMYLLWCIIELVATRCGDSFKRKTELTRAMIVKCKLWEGKQPWCALLSSVCATGILESIPVATVRAGCWTKWTLLWSNPVRLFWWTSWFIDHLYMVIPSTHWGDQMCSRDAAFIRTCVAAFLVLASMCWKLYPAHSLRCT